MLRILFLILWVIPVLAFPAQGQIEIYANGHKYASIQEYLQRKGKSIQLNREDLSDATRNLGLKFGFYYSQTL